MATNGLPINPQAVGDITVDDELPPEIAATAMAMLSRNARGSTETLKKAATSNGGFIERYYVGYNHRSIGDCGSTSIYVNGCSLLCAKAIEDSRRFDGQESSTRYLDLGTAVPIDPIKGSRTGQIQTDLLDFYRAAQDDVLAYVVAQHPHVPGTDEAEWRRACEARRFDILRGFLPAGIPTNIGWHTTLSHAAEHLDFLRHHPLQEVREVARAMLRKLAARYPHTFFEPGKQQDPKARTRALEAEEYLAEMGRISAYDPMEMPAAPTTRVDIDRRALEPFLETLAKRPRFYPPPERFNRFGTVELLGRIDFGSHRDLQRHRGAYVPMPLVDFRHGFHPWYLEALPATWRSRAEDLVGEVQHAIRGMDAPPEDIQYLVPIGAFVPLSATGGVSAMVYIAERRSDKTVHPTLRPIAQTLGKAIGDWEPRLRLYVDHDPDDWTERRGRQTILEKPAPLSPSRALTRDFSLKTRVLPSRPWNRPFRTETEHPTTSKSTGWTGRAKAPCSRPSAPGPATISSSSSTASHATRPIAGIPPWRNLPTSTSSCLANPRK